MKKMLFPAAIVLLGFASSCTNDSATSEHKEDSTAKTNIAVCDKINDVISNGDVAKLDSFIAKDAVDHGNPKGEVKGLDSIKAELAQMHVMMPDMKWEKVHEATNGDFVYQWLRFTGTAAANNMGMPPGKFSMEGLEVTRMENGKAMEHWEFMEAKEMMKMMPPGNNMNGNMGYKTAPDSANNKHPLNK
jgi:predicted SnoaL-like aldol condensation-catalyzing enzyme